MATSILEAWRSGAARPALLVQIDFVAPSAKTIRLANDEVDTKDGKTWEHAISSAEPLRASTGFLAPGVEMVTTTIVVSNERLSFQAANQRFTSLASAYYFQGADVTMYLWDKSFASFSSAYRIFTGVVNRYEATESAVTLFLMQGRAWNKKVPQRVVNKIDYPESPDIAQGLPVPVVYGLHDALTMRSPWTSATTNIRDHEDAGAASGVVPLMLVDRGTGSAKVKLVAAQHACAKIMDRSVGLTTFIRGADRLSPLDTPGLTETLGSGQADSYITIDDDTLIAYGAITPIDIRLGAGNSTADNPRRALDVYDETTFASLDQGASKGVLEFTMPDYGALGTIISVSVVVAFIGNAGNGNTLRVRPYEPVAPSAGAAVTATSTTTTPTIMSGTWDATWYTKAWNFGSGTAAAATTTDMRIDFSGGTTNKASIIWAALVVKYRPQRSVVIPALVAIGNPGNPSDPRGRNPRSAPPPLGFVPFRPGSPTIYQLEGQFFGNVKGYGDDGSGTYTGTASAVIKRPCDIARHLLVTYGGLSSSTDFETGASSFGSFVAARSRLRNAQDTEFDCAPHIGTLSRVSDILRELASESLSVVYLDRFTNKWLWHVWVPGSQANYDRSFRWDDIALESIGLTSDVDAETGIRVRYFKDYQTNRTQFEAFVNDTGSSQGFTDPSFTDQKLTVVAATNDKIDWNNGANRTATLTAATYSPAALGQHVSVQMNAVSGNVFCYWGFDIVSGYNDKLEFDVIGSPYTATLAAGPYNVDTLCIEVLRALKTADGSVNGHVFTGCTYDQGTNKFSLTATSAWGIVMLTGATFPNQSAWRHLGFVVDSGSPQSNFTAAAARYAERFYFVERGNNSITIKWATGTNTLANCHLLLGFPNAADTAGATQSGTFLRGDRQATAIDVAAKTGPKAEMVFDAQWLRSEAAAVQVRNRLFDLSATPRTVVKFSTNCAPDLQRFRAISFSAELDAHIPYPRAGTDGSWAGKVFIVTEVVQHLVDSWHQDITAYEA